MSSYFIYCDNCCREFVCDYLPQQVTAGVPTLEEIKKQLNIALDFTDDDEYLQLLAIDVAIFAQNWTSRVFVETPYVISCSRFPVCRCQGYNNKPCLELKRAPLESITSIEYVNKQNETITLDPDTYIVTNTAQFPFISPVDEWPRDVNCEIPRPVTINANFGYGFPGDVPVGLKLGMLQQITALYENRGDCACTCDNTLPMSSINRYNQYKIFSISNGSLC